MRIKLFIFLALYSALFITCKRDLLDEELTSIFDDNQIMAVQASGSVFGNGLEILTLMVDTAKAMYERTRVAPPFSDSLFANNLSGALWDNTLLFVTDSAYFTATPVVDAVLGDTSMQLIGMYKRNYVVYLAFIITLRFMTFQ